MKTNHSSIRRPAESTRRSAEKRSAEDEAADLPTKPTKMSKFGFAIGSQTARKASAISIRLGASKPKETVPTLAPKTLSVAAAFNEDEDSEPEEMPPEAKMRMKNIGRDTPTSAGPNSFNKGKHGFSDNQKLWERNIKSHLGSYADKSHFCRNLSQPESRIHDTESGSAPPASPLPATCMHCASSQPSAVPVNRGAMISRTLA